MGRKTGHTNTVAGSDAFDAVAGDYDARFTSTELGGWLRQAVWEQLAAVFQAGDRILELGCGTGTDALWLAQKGMDVVATDGSPEMLRTAARKLKAAEVEARVKLHILDLQHPVMPAGVAENSGFDGALSNFGVLNCLPDRRPLARALARWLRPGGRLVLVAMGPFCLWEMAWHLLHGQVRTALRRFRSGSAAQIGNDAAVQVWYPSPRRLRAEFEPFFRCLKTVGVGVLLPPSYLNHLVEQWPAVFGQLAGWERRWADRFPWTWLNDHYLMVLERYQNRTESVSSVDQYQSQTL